MSADLKCPYCGADNEICHDDGFGYEEGVPHEMECSSCEKTFVFRTTMHFSYRPMKADCLNGSPHRLRDWVQLWLNADSNTATYGRICGDCGHEERKAMTPEEAKQ